MVKYIGKIFSNNRINFIEESNSKLESNDTSLLKKNSIVDQKDPLESQVFLHKKPQSSTVEMLNKLCLSVTKPTIKVLSSMDPRVETLASFAALSFDILHNKFNVWRAHSNSDYSLENKTREIENSNKFNNP